MAHRHHHGPLTEGAAAPAALASASAPAASSAAAPAPGMAMAFSSGHDVVLLFEWWHPTTPFAYALSLGVVFGLCLLQEWLLAKKLRRAVPHCKPCEDGAAQLLGAAALVLSSVNMAGGFLVLKRCSNGTLITYPPRRGSTSTLP